jgi:hypothetical protein
MEPIEFDRTAVVFHFNKKHNEDPSIPPWVLKIHGETFYVHHLEISPGVGFSTKETPDNPHTKASLKLKGRCRIFQTEQGIIEAVIG